MKVNICQLWCCSREEFLFHIESNWIENISVWLTSQSMHITSLTEKKTESKIAILAVNLIASNLLGNASELKSNFNQIFSLQNWNFCSLWCNQCRWNSGIRLVVWLADQLLQKVQSTERNWEKKGISLKVFTWLLVAVKLQIINSQYSGQI